MRALRRLGIAVSLTGGLTLGCVAEYTATDLVDDTEADGEEADTDSPEDCEDDELWCDGVCIDPTANPDHCGACSQVCLTGTQCFDGECVRACDDGCDELTQVCNNGICDCRVGLENCLGICVDTRRDPTHCGECFLDCADGDFCGDGDCQANCDEFEDACQGVCTNFDSDPFHCGQCGRECMPGTECLGGECLEVLLLDPVECDECPCEVCSPLGGDACCYNEFTETNVCLLGELDCP